jgi:predicted nucleic acid-binding Zn ribbon protein
MPTYEFQTADGRIVERRYKISEVPSEITLDDGSVATRQISGGADLVFKGSGFYITDYGKDGKKDQRDAAKKSTEKKADSGSGSSAASGTSSTPASGASGGSSGSSTSSGSSASTSSGGSSKPSAA